MPQVVHVSQSLQSTLLKKSSHYPQCLYLTMSIRLDQGNPTVYELCFGLFVCLLFGVCVQKDIFVPAACTQINLCLFQTTTPRTMKTT